MYTIIDEYKSENATMRKMLASNQKMLATKDKTIATNQKMLVTKDKTIATKDKALQKALAEIEKLRRKFGVNSQTVEIDN